MSYKLAIMAVAVGTFCRSLSCEKQMVTMVKRQKIQIGRYLLTYPWQHAVNRRRLAELIAKQAFLNAHKKKARIL